MSVENDYRERERKDLPQDATARERLSYIKELTLFHKTMFGDISYNETQAYLDKILKVCNDSK